MINKKRKPGRPSIVSKPVQKNICLHESQIEWIEKNHDSVSGYVRDLVSSHVKSCDKIELSDAKGEKCIRQIRFERSDFESLVELSGVIGCNNSEYVRELIYIEMEKAK